MTLAYFLNVVGYVFAFFVFCVALHVVLFVATKAIVSGYYSTKSEINLKSSEEKNKSPK